MKQRVTKEVSIGSVPIGGMHPVAIQTMWSEPLPPDHDHHAYEALLSTLRSYATLGCNIIRFSYPSSDDRQVFSRICADSPMPVVADIHYDWRLALEALACGAHKIRINPGTIGSKWKVEEIVRCAKDHHAAIRIGLNGGSLPHSLRASDHASAMVSTAFTYIDWFEALNFTDIVVSLKDTDCNVTYQANHLIAEAMSYPLHIGVTEAGSLVSSLVRSTWTLGRLLAEGIGETIRISITDDCAYEIIGAKELLRTVGREPGGIRIVSCPRCGRATFDSQAFVQKVERRLLSYTMPLTVAIMGCAVNGPGEASHADLAITGVGNKVYLYERGKKVREVSEQEAEEELFSRLEELAHGQ